MRKAALANLLLVGACHAWHGSTVGDLHAQYDNIFPHGNRNAASHRWSTFLLKNAKHHTQAELERLFTGFCPVSGSPVHPDRNNAFDVVLASMGGGGVQGQTHHCCWPCLCDLHDFARVDTKTVKTKDGPHTYRFFVIGDPCIKPDALETPFKQASGWGAPTTIAKSASDVTCGADGRLEKATFSDRGGVIIGMVLGASDVGPAAAKKAVSDWAAGGDPHRSLREAALTAPVLNQARFAPRCAHRAALNFNSGMGDIFRAVAEINLLPMRVAGKIAHCDKPMSMPASSRANADAGSLAGATMLEAFACQGLDRWATAN